jgi:hypothetical protein
MKIDGDADTYASLDGILREKMDVITNQNYNAVVTRDATLVFTTNLIQRVVWGGRFE